MAPERKRAIAPASWAGLVGLAHVVIRYWALSGGVLLIGLVLMTAAGAMSNLLFSKPFPFDYDVVKHGVAIAAFTFLPYCQLTHGNVSVDVFTERAGERTKALMLILSSVIAAVLAALLFRQMWLGMLDFMEYREVMVSLRIPLWTAFPFALVSLALMFVAALITAGQGIRGLRRGALDLSL